MNAREVLTHMIDDRIALLGHAHWKLNMIRREITQPDLNSPYTRLCKEEIKPSTKLVFRYDLSKYLRNVRCKTSGITNAEKSRISDHSGLQLMTSH